MRFIKQSPLDRGTQFHLHLDKCQRCREQPFNLCLEGQMILLDRKDTPVKSASADRRNRIEKYGDGEHI